MKKEKFHIEHIFDKVSRQSLQNHLTTALELSTWSVDEVIIDDSLYILKWSKEAQEVTVINSKPGNFIRYRRVDEEDENACFGLIIYTVELTGPTTPEVTDFPEPGEKKDPINLQDLQVEGLERTLDIQSGFTEICGALSFSTLLLPL